MRELTETYQTVPGAETLFTSVKTSVGKCPRCGADVNRFFTAKKKALTKSVAAALLRDGRVKLTNCYSEKTGKTYDATVFLEDDNAMEIRITKELPKALDVRPTVGEIYEAEYRMTPPPAPRMAYFIRVEPNRVMVCVFPDECEGGDW